MPRIKNKEIRKSVHMTFRGPLNTAFLLTSAAITRARMLVVRTGFCMLVQQRQQ